MEKEIRAINMPARIEVRDGRRVINGYPIVYNKDSEDMGFIERIAPGAARKALKNSDVRGLKNHEPSLIFARQGVNLELKEDKTGVYYEATEIDTRNFREVAEEVRLGLLTGQSFGFTILSDKWEGLDTDKPTRTITEIGEIFDVGPVTYPAYQDTTVALRSLARARDHKNQPPFQDPDVKITCGDHNLQVSLNDDNIVQNFETFVENIRSGSSQTTQAHDSAGDGQTTAKSSDTASGIMERINQRLKKED